MKAKKVVKGHATMTPIVLARDGCDRATGYGQANKIVRAPEGLYVTWLDTTYRCMVTHVRQDGSVGDTIPMFQGFDNHCAGTIIRTPDGVVHFASGSHSVAFMYRSSATPMVAASWSLPECVGMLSTYPSLVHDLEGRLHLAGRYSVTDRTTNVYGVCWGMKPRGRPWQKSIAIVRMPAPQYSCPGNALAVGPDGTVHMVLGWYKTWPAGAGGRDQPIPPRSLGVSHLEMSEPGEWRHTDGRMVESYQVAMEDTPLIIARPQGNPRPGNVAVLPDGRPLFAVWDQDTGAVELAIRQADRTWRITELTAQADGAGPGKCFCTTPQVAVDARGDILLVATQAECTRWGHVSAQLHVYRIAAEDGAVTRHEAIPKTDPHDPDWLPNIEKPGPGIFPEELHLVFQTGQRGEGCTNAARCAVKWTVLR